jgi:hypothetical protein
MEPIRLIGSWILFSHKDTPASNRDLEHAESQLHHAREPFPRTPHWLGCYKKFTGWTKFEHALPTSLLEPATRLEEARVALIRRYMRAEAGVEFDEAAPIGVHAEFAVLMQRTEAMSRDIQQFSLDRMLYDARQAGDEHRRADEDDGCSRKRPRSEKSRGKERQRPSMSPSIE